MVEGSLIQLLQLKLDSSAQPHAKLALVLCIAQDKKFEELFYFEEGEDKK